MQSGTKPTFKQRALEELKKFFQIFLYVWVVLSLFALHKFMLIAHTRLMLDLGFALLNALILAKMILLGEDLRLDRKFERAPPAYAVLYRAAIFAALLVVLSVIEEAVPGLWRGESFADAVRHIGDGRIGGVFIVAMIMFVVLIPFFAFKEIADAIGEAKLRRLLFEPQAKDKAPQAG